MAKTELEVQGEFRRKKSNGKLRYATYVNKLKRYNVKIRYATYAHNLTQHNGKIR